MSLTSRSKQPVAVGHALLVDLDGTLINTTAGVEASWRRVAAAAAVDFAGFQPFMHGIPAVQVLEHVLPQLTPAQRSNLADQVLSDQASPESVVTWMPGAEHLVNQLRSTHWGIVTSGTRRLAQASMDKVDCNHRR